MLHGDRVRPAVAASVVAVEWMTPFRSATHLHLPAEVPRIADAGLSQLWFACLLRIRRRAQRANDHAIVVSSGTVSLSRWI
jgi:hypothetical protein